MNISYQWLKEYVDFSLSAEEVCAALTSEGLEVGALEEVQSIKGGLKGYENESMEDIMDVMKALLSSGMMTPITRVCCVLRLRATSLGT